MKEHFEHHRGHMLGCLAAASVLVIGIVFAIPAVAIVGGVACAVMCASMIWMMVTAGRTQ